MQSIFSVTGTAANHLPTFRIIDTKLYVPILTLSTQVNEKLLEQLIKGFKRTFNWNKYQSKIASLRQNRYLDSLIDPSFHGVNRLFVSSLEDENDQESYKIYFRPTVKVKDYNVMIKGRIFFNQLVKNDLRTYENI